MTPWNRFEQYFKHNQLRMLQRWLGLAELAPQQIDPERIKRILVVRQHDQLGDFLLSTPVFGALRNHFKGRTITVIARKYTAMLAQHHEAIDEIITFYEHGKDWDRAGLASLLQAVRNKFDLAVVLNTVSHSLSSDLLARFCCRTYLLGTAHLPFGGTDSNFFYNLRAPLREGIRHQSERNLDILRYIGVESQDAHERICLTKEEKGWARASLVAKGWDPQRLLIMVHPGAGKMGNRWPVEAFAEAANRLQKMFAAQIAVSATLLSAKLQVLSLKPMIGICEIWRLYFSNPGCLCVMILALCIWPQRLAPHWWLFLAQRIRRNGSPGAKNSWLFALTIKYAAL
jgi:hypothetical protein